VRLEEADPEGEETDSGPWRKLTSWYGKSLLGKDLLTAHRDLNGSAVGMRRFRRRGWASHPLFGITRQGTIITKATADIQSALLKIVES
jgi:hypothetical protein